MDWLYVFFTACICFITVFKTLNEDSDSAIFVLLAIVLFLAGMGMFPQLFLEI